MVIVFAYASVQVFLHKYKILAVVEDKNEIAHTPGGWNCLKYSFGTCQSRGKNIIAKYACNGTCKKILLKELLFYWSMTVLLASIYLKHYHTCQNS